MRECTIVLSSLRSVCVILFSLCIPSIDPFDVISPTERKVSYVSRITNGISRILTRHIWNKDGCPNTGIGDAKSGQMRCAGTAGQR